MQFDLHFRYDDEETVRPYVVNCDLSHVGDYSSKVSHLARVAQVFINIHPSSPYCEFFEFTI